MKRRMHRERRSARDRRLRPVGRHAVRAVLFESLECRTLLTTTVYLDFGAGIGMGNTLSVDVDDFRDIFGAGTGTNMTNGVGMVPGLDANDSLDFTPLGYDFNLDGNTNNADITAFANAVVPLVQRVLEPFDITIAVAAATSLADAVTSVGNNAADASGEFDAYVFVSSITSDGIGNASVGGNFGLLGRAALTDLGAQTGNNTDEASLTFVDRIFAGTNGTQGTAAFNQNLAWRTAYTSTHEAFHTFSNRHTPDEMGTMPQASANQRLLASGDVIRRGSNTRTNPFIVTRYDLMHGAGVAEPNNYLLAANDGDIGLRDMDTNGTPDLAYSTGTGANDQITFTDAGGGMVNVAVNPFSNQGRTLAIDAGEAYTIDLATDTDGEILVDASINADQVVIDATILANFRARGGVGADSAVSATADSDLLTLNSGGLAGTFVPGPDGINGSVSYAGGADVDFSEFEDVDADNVALGAINVALSKGNNVDEGEQFMLDVDFTNIDTLDSHEIVVDWGNGDVSMMTLGAGDRDASFIYKYPDDHPITGTASDALIVSVTVTDDDGDTDSVDEPITVHNVDPDILNITLDTDVIDEGDTVNVTGFFGDPALITGATSESWTGTAVWSDGVATVLVIDQSDGTFTTSRTFLDDHPMTGTPSDQFTLDITINDDDLGTDTDTSAVLTVNNVDPVIVDFASDATFDDKAVVGEPVNILANFTDVGILDTHTAVVDWGDGTVEMVTVNQGAGSGTVTGSHAYMTGGIFDVTLTLTDDDTGSAMAMTTAVVSGVGLTPDGVLQIIGTNDNDRTTITKSGKTLRVFADFLQGARFKSFKASDVLKVVAYLCEGNDHFIISSNVAVPAVVHGGGGNDLLKAGRGPSVLLGDEGNDRLIGGRGRDILIGGLGADLLMGGLGDDLLIGGTTTHDDNDAALMDLISEWDAGDSYSVRVERLRDGTGPTGVQLAKGVTVFDDGDSDRFVGSFSRDWFFFDPAEDSTPDRRNNEATN